MEIILSRNDSLVWHLLNQNETLKNRFAMKLKQCISGRICGTKQNIMNDLFLHLIDTIFFFLSFISSLKAPPERFCIRMSHSDGLQTDAKLTCNNFQNKHNDFISSKYKSKLSVADMDESSSLISSLLRA